MESDMKKKPFEEENSLEIIMFQVSNFAERLIHHPSCTFSLILKAKSSKLGKSSFKAQKSYLTQSYTSQQKNGSISPGVGLVCHPGLLALLVIISCGPNRSGPCAGSCPKLLHLFHSDPTHAPTFFQTR